MEIKQELSPEEIESFKYEDIKREDEIPLTVKEQITDFMQKSNRNKDIESTSQMVKDYLEKQGVNVSKDQLVKFYYPDFKTGSCTDCNQFNDGLYFLISFSLPRDYIKSLIDEAYEINQKNSFKVHLVIQGFVDDSLKKTAKKLMSITDGNPAKAAIEINPELFKNNNVTHVPFIIFKQGDKIQTMSGAVSINFALDRFELSYSEDNHGRFGVLYPVAEKNFFDLLKEKQSVVEQKIAEARQRAVSKAFVVKGFDHIKTAQKNNVFYVDPSYEVPSDFKNPLTGEVIVPKGTKLNPVDYASFPRTLVIDGSQEKQLEYLRKNASNFEIILVTKGDLVKLMTTYKKRMYRFVPEMEERFKIKATPSIIEQENRMLKVTEVYLAR